MELNVKVTVHTPADVLRYGRSGAISMDLAARTCLSMSGWKDKEVEAVLGTKKQQSKKTGRPSGYDSRKEEVRTLVDAGEPLSGIASALKVSMPTARAWVSRLAEEAATAVPSDEAEAA